MNTLVIAIIVAVCLVGFFGYTVIGKRISLRAKGAAEEKIAEDAATVDGAKSYYNAAISKKEDVYRQAYKLHTEVLGEIKSYEDQLRTFKKQRFGVITNLNACVAKGDDENAKVYLRQQNDIDEKVAVIEETLEQLRETERVQKEQLDNAHDELEKLKSEKDSAIFKLKAADVTQSLKSIPDASDDETDKMLETVRDGISRKVKSAEGSRIAYDSSADVQAKRLDKKLKEEDLDRQLSEYKKTFGKK